MNAYGLPRKTNKAKLMQLLEKGTAVVERYPKNACSIYDGMALLQRFQPPAGATFVVLTDKIFDAVTSNPSRRIDVVFDVYFDVSIKNAERAKRSSCPEGVKYKNILLAYPIKSLKKFMSIQTNRTEVVHFLVSQWKRSEYTSRLGNKVLYITEGSKCWKLTTGSTDNVPELESSHEEADTRMILHAKHTNGPVVVHADDTDVIVLLLTHSDLLGTVYMRTGRGSKARIIPLAPIKEKLLKQLSPGITAHDFLKSLCGLHALTGCDSVSSLSGKGKTKAFKLAMKKQKFVKALADLGSSWELSDETLEVVEDFICELYGKRCQDIDLLRYNLYCAKGGKVESEALPPCRSSLKLHVLRANYQSAIWRRVIFPQPNVPSPHGHGWDICEDAITIQWLGSKPAPEEFLELLCCTCK